MIKVHEISAERSVAMPSHSWMHDYHLKSQNIKISGNTQTMHAFAAEATIKVDR